MPPTEPLFDPEDLPEELITQTTTMCAGPDGLKTTKTTVAMWYADEDLGPLMVEVPKEDLEAFMKGLSLALQYFVSVPKPKSEILDKEKEPTPEDDIPF